MKSLLALAVAGHLASVAPPLPGAPALPSSPATGLIETACQGCGCRGGAGWRIHRTGKCAGKANLAKECGSPPSPSLCTKEN